MLTKFNKSQQVAENSNLSGKNVFKNFQIFRTSIDARFSSSVQAELMRLCCIVNEKVAPPATTTTQFKMRFESYKAYAMLTPIGTNL